MSKTNFMRLGSWRWSVRSEKEMASSARKEQKKRTMRSIISCEEPLMSGERGRGGKVLVEDIAMNEMEEKEEDNSGSCIIVVGSTGAGKSSTIGKLTGALTQSGSGHERVTKYCQIHRSMVSDNEPVWVDTVGWDDEDVEDDKTFRDILRFIDKYNITRYDRQTQR